jgi:hypothetical protein
MKCPGLFIVIIISVCFTTAVFAQNKPDSVVFLPLGMNAPANATKLGTIAAGNNATATKCDYEALVTEAKEKAVAMGGNIVKITKLREPAFISKCYSISADVYHISELPDYGINLNEDKSITANGANYAVLYIYRLQDTVAFSGAYKLHKDGDSVICTVKSKSWDSVQIYKEGALTLWGKIEKRQELKLDVRYGRSYYVRCGLEKGSIRNVPVIELVDNKIGSEEFQRLRKGRKDLDVKYLQQVH